MIIKSFAVILIVFLSFFSKAHDVKSVKFHSFFASIKFNEVNVRKGPNQRYPIDWVFKAKGEPVEVIGEFEHWYRIRKLNNEEGWVKKVMLSKKRYGIIKKCNFNNNNKLYCPVYQNDKLNSNINAYIENDVRVAINKCSTSFCYIETKTAAGWIDKSNLFGILLNEKF